MTLVPGSWLIVSVVTWPFRNLAASLPETSSISFFNIAIAHSQFTYRKFLNQLQAFVGYLRVGKVQSMNHSSHISGYAVENDFKHLVVYLQITQIEFTGWVAVGQYLGHTPGTPLDRGDQH